MGDSCGGCPYHKFPYKAQLPIFVNGERPLREFKSDKDVWDVIDLLIEEVHEGNKKGKEFDVAQSIYSQLPFFCCRNIIFDKDIQKDIQRYIYCKDNNVPPYKGDYNEQPALWVDRYFIIKSAFAKKEKQIFNRSMKEE